MLADLDGETQRYGLAITTGLGLARGSVGDTLGGGIGWPAPTIPIQRWRVTE